MAEYISTDPDAGKVVSPRYLSTDPNAGIGKPAMVSRETSPSKGRAYGDINPLTGVAEGGIGVLTGGIAAPISGIAGIGAMAAKALGADIDPAEVVNQTAESLTYRPRSKIGRGAVDAVSYPFEVLAKGAQKASDKTFDITGSPLAATHVNATIQSLPMLVGMNPIKVTRGVKAAEVPPKSTGAGAEAAVNELQAQSQIRAGAEPVRDLTAQSAYEAALLERDKITTPLRQEAFRSKERVDTAPTMKLIDELEAKNPDRVVRAALNEVRGTIERAVEGGQGASLPSAGARLSVDELKALQGQSGRMDIAMADEVRQSINRMKEAKGEKALDKHTQELLGRVQTKFLDGTPQIYRDYLSEYSRLSKPLDEFKVAGTAGGKIATDQAAFHLLNAADKQALIQSVFESKTPGRSLSELVRDTEHSPQALRGVREAYTDWLTQSDAMTKLPTAKGLTERWAETREAAKSSKLMSDEHIAAMDKIMNDVREASSRGWIKRAWASTAGWMLGAQVGHPIAAAHAARDVVAGSAKKNTQKALSDAMMKISADQEGAAALAAPPNPATVERVLLMLPQELAATLTLPSFAAEQRKRRKDPLALEYRP